jgi:sugar phosphate isomerase/epimerase
MKMLGFHTHVLLLIIFSCSPGEKNTANSKLFTKDNLIAWCVVPFDSAERTPEERAQMLEDLGFKKFAYDWRLKHLPTFGAEINALKKHGIELTSVWLWIDTDSTEIFDEANKQLMEIIKQNNVKTDFWVGFGNKHFEGLSDEAKLEKAMASVSYIQNRAKELGCTISLYNHGDWFGEPENQVRIIEKMGAKDVGIVYNFHHAHTQIKEFPRLLQKMLPYLNTVNLNGMKVEGPKILTIGEGDQELGMLNILRETGYAGSLGILCHIETEDARVVLERNLTGLRSLLSEMGQDEALKTY